MTTTTAVRICRHIPPDFPEPHVKPGREGYCVKCDGLIDPEWAISLDNTRAFLRRLETAFPVPPEHFEKFEEQVLLRQQHGERLFRQSSLGADMQANGNEEATDACMYAVIGILQEVRAGTDPNWDVALEIGSLAARIFQLNQDWKQKGRGRPHAAKAHDEEE